MRYKYNTLPEKEKAKKEMTSESQKHNSRRNEKSILDKTGSTKVGEMFCNNAEGTSPSKIGVFFSEFSSYF